VATVMFDSVDEMYTYLLVLRARLISFPFVIEGLVFINLTLNSFVVESCHLVFLLFIDTNSLFVVAEPGTPYMYTAWCGTNVALVVSTADKSFLSWLVS
jgi:hypothetical protein